MGRDRQKDSASAWRPSNFCETDLFFLQIRLCDIGLNLYVNTSHLKWISVTYTQRNSLLLYCKGIAIMEISCISQRGRFLSRIFKSRTKVCCPGPVSLSLSVLCLPCPQLCFQGTVIRKMNPVLYKTKKCFR